MSIIDVLNQYDTITYYDEQGATNLKHRITCTYDHVFMNDFNEVVLAAHSGDTVCVLSGNDFALEIIDQKYNRDIVRLYDNLGRSIKLIAKKI